MRDKGLRIGLESLHGRRLGVVTRHRHVNHLSGGRVGGCILLEKIYFGEVADPPVANDYPVGRALEPKGVDGPCFATGAVSALVAGESVAAYCGPE